MPEKETIERAHEDEREGKAPSTQAGEFVREEIHHVREGKHGARSPQQAIAIGLSKARRAGVKLAAPRRGKTSARTRAQAKRDLRKGKTSRRRKPSARRSRAVSRALKREGRKAASRQALGRQARRSAKARGRSSRRGAARRAVRTKGRTGLKLAARKAAKTRQAHRKAA
ncbi:MAG TPA: DNA-binding protein [Terriglobales bacterium]